MLATFSNTANAAALLGNQTYGSQQYQSGSMGTNKGFTGQYNDNATGLDYYNARYYDPVAGVFLSADTVQGNAKGMNPYGYVNGNPETLSDPTGMHVVCGDTCGGGGGGGGSGYNSGGGVGGDISTLEQGIVTAVQQFIDPETDPALPIVISVAVATSPLWLSILIPVAVGVVIGLVVGAIYTVATTTTLASGDLPIDGATVVKGDHPDQPSKPPVGGNMGGNNGGGPPGNVAAAAPSPDDGSNRPKLYRMGNKTSPRLTNVRLVRANGGDPDIRLNENGNVCPNQGGISLNEVPKGNNLWSLSPETNIGEDLQLRNDSGTHWSLEPAREMPLQTYLDALAKLNSALKPCF